jgi:hypothetical protein
VQNKEERTVHDAAECEEWKDIKGYEGMYQVSNLGRVKSLDRLVTFGDNYKRLHKGKMITPVDNGRGYMRVVLKDHNKNKYTYVHRLVAEAFLQKPEDTAEVNHKDFNKANNKASNLEWVTRTENVRYNLICNRGRQRITMEDVKTIRERKEKGESCREVFSDYEKRLSFSAFCKVYRGYTWRYKSE